MYISYVEYVNIEHVLSIVTYKNWTELFSLYEQTFTFNLTLRQSLDNGRI